MGGCSRAGRSTGELLGRHQEAGWVVRAGLRKVMETGWGLSQGLDLSSQKERGG